MCAAEGAEYTTLSLRHFLSLADEGLFPRVRIGRRVLFRRASIDAALAALETQTK